MMSLEEEYNVKFERFVLTFAEYKKALVEERSNDEIMALTAACEDAREQLIQFKKESMDQSDVPDVDVYIREDGTFNYFANTIFKAVYESGTAPEGGKLKAEELYRAGELIRQYIEEGESL